MVRKCLLLMVSVSSLSSCASSNAIRTSQNSAIIQTSAAPVCGAQGAARVAQAQAAVETLKAGYDRYIITSAASANNVSVNQMPGSYQTQGSANIYGSRGTYQSSTTYVPGPTIVAGTHDQSFGIVMFKDGEPGAQQAIPARETLGPEWKEIVAKGGAKTC
ncbi:MAG: hypothetical protein EOO81_01260 [Oxalobacteraceae bacterium]|nr:MAG: hypothetical protein EOO81_01260 [Oxalobacteraceae bacterium]